MRVFKSRMTAKLQIRKKKESKKKQQQKIELSKVSLVEVVSRMAISQWFLMRMM